jgi:parafibromin
MSSSDPLLALRQATSSSAEITFTNSNGLTPTLSSATHIQLAPGVSFTKDTPTRYKKSPTEQYTLEAVYLAWSLRGSSVGDYMKQVKEHGLAIGFVSVTDRKGVVEWLEGKGSDANLVPIGGVYLHGCGLNPA